MQARVALEREARPAPRQLGREAQEEEHVADALFRAQHELPAG